MSGVTPEARAAAIRRIAPAVADPMFDAADIVEQMELIGWSPGGAPVRPTRESLLSLLTSAQHAPMETHDGRTGECMSCPVPLSELGPEAVADALIAADHLWGEEPGEDPLPWICYGCGGRYAEAEPNWRGHRTVLKPRPASEWQAGR